MLINEKMNEKSVTKTTTDSGNYCEARYKSAKGKKKNQTKMRVQLILKGMKNILSISSFYVNRCQQLGF